MAGNPILRARYDGKPPVRGIPERIPKDVWRTMTDVEKIKANYGMNLDQVRDLCSIDWADADLHERALIVRIYECHMRTGRGFARDKSRERETANLLRGVRETLEAVPRVMANQSAPASDIE